MKEIFACQLETNNILLALRFEIEGVLGILVGENLHLDEPKKPRQVGHSEMLMRKRVIQHAVDKAAAFGKSIRQIHVARTPADAPKNR